MRCTTRDPVFFCHLLVVVVVVLLMIAIAATTKTVEAAWTAGAINIRPSTRQHHHGVMAFRRRRCGQAANGALRPLLPATAAAAAVSATTGSVVADADAEDAAALEANIAISSTSSSTSLNAHPHQHKKPVKGDIVTVKCRLTPENGFVPEVLIDGVILGGDSDSNNDDNEAVLAFATLSFLLHGGNYLPGLHDLVSTMTVGDSVSHVSLDAGWGARNPALTATLTYADAGLLGDDAISTIQPGVQLHLENGLVCTVTARTDDNFTVDANPPLAGASYLADVKLVSVEPGPQPMPYYDDATAPTDDNNSSSNGNNANNNSNSRYEIATFALGCFWGAELAFQREPGVVGTSVGYTQGKNIINPPTYEQVCTGTTGHTEAVLVTFDPLVTCYERLLHFAMDRLGADKYLLNRVGNDEGTQYRHGMYYHTAAQKRVAVQAMAGELYGPDCVTECLPAAPWFPAEEYHQQYLLKGGQSARKGDTTAIRCYG